MTTISELFGRSITPEAKECHTPRIDTLSAPIQAKSEKEFDLYEAAVFNFFVVNKDNLAIKKVLKFTALVVDGAVELQDGKRLTVEIKYQMGWEKACQAEWQFRTFLKRPVPLPFPVDGGIVVFEEFSGDWSRQAQCRVLENGWSHWYRCHAEVEGLRLDLLRFRAGTLEGFPTGQIFMAQIKSLSPEELSALVALAGPKG
jgi:hypothetical protein